LEQLELRYEWQKNAGLPVEKLDEWDIFKLEPNLSKLVIGALRFPLDWQVENSKIVEAFNLTLSGMGLNKWMQKYHLDKIRPRNGEEFISRKAISLLFDGECVTGVRTEIEDFSAPIVIITVGAWTSLLEMPEDFAHFINVSPVRGQILSFKDNQKLFNHVIYSHRGYVVPRRDNRILVGATTENAGFDNRTTAAGVASLLSAAFEISPEFRNLSIKNIWSGLRPKTIDGWPLLGEFPEKSGLYFATGHYRNGILLAPLTGQIIAEKIVKGIDSPYLQIFNPSRFQ
jgi:glycine oxidase